MSAAITFALIGVVVVVLILFWLATDKYLTEVLSELNDDEENGHDGAGH
jgi:hypothetical protein